MLREVALVLLRALRQQRLHNRYADAASYVSRQIHHARNLIVFVSRHADIRHGVDRHKEKCNARRLKNPELDSFAKADAEVQLHHVEQSRGAGEKSNSRSEERRVGKECRSRRSQYQYKKK